MVCKLIPECFFTWEFVWFGLEQLSDTGFFILKAESTVDTFQGAGGGRLPPPASVVLRSAVGGELSRRRERLGSGSSPSPVHTSSPGMEPCGRREGRF